MGVYRLTQWLTKHKVGKPIVCEQLKEQTIAVDANGWIYQYYSCHHSIEQKLTNGNYRQFDMFIQEWCHYFLSNGIQLVFVFDSSKRNNDRQFKKETWISRHNQKKEIIDSVVSYCYDGILNCKTQDIPLPPLAMFQLRATLRRLDIPMRVAYGEADSLCAKMVYDNEAYAVMSSDSDFCIFDRCRYIPFDHVSLSEHTMICIDQSDIIHALNWSNLEASKKLITLSILMGNDYTRSFVDNQLEHIFDIPTQIVQVADLIETRPEYIDDKLQSWFDRCPEFKDAADYSVSTYKLMEMETWDSGDEELVVDLENGKDCFKKLGSSNDLVLESPFGSASQAVFELKAQYKKDKLPMEDLWCLIHKQVSVVNKEDPIWQIKREDQLFVLSLRYLIERLAINRSLFNSILKQYVVLHTNPEYTAPFRIDMNVLTASSIFQVVYKYVCLCLGDNICPSAVFHGEFMYYNNIDDESLEKYMVLRKVAIWSPTGEKRSFPRKRKEIKTKPVIMSEPSSPTEHELPIQKHRSIIVNHVKQQSLTVICGETGCGKSSQVPQFLMKEFPECRIAITQPRRIAAIALARRVSEELKEPLGTRVGFSISGNTVRSRQTKVNFMTSGYMMEWMSHNMDNMNRYDIWIIDEVHERSIEMDILLLFAKHFMEQGGKLILMSATLSSSSLFEYYGYENKPLHVGTVRFPITTHYCNNLPFPGEKQALQRLVNAKTPRHLFQHQSRIIVHLVRQIAMRHPSRSILIFVNGLHEIEDITASLNSQKYQCIPMHSTLNPQEMLQQIDDGDGVTNVLIATNIAESSLTIPSVDWVIDCGTSKSVIYEKTLRLQTDWISKTSAIQRKGRTGRTAPGNVIRLYMESQYEQMDDFNVPEILRLPLDELILKLKGSISDSIADVLRRTINPPCTANIEDSFDKLYQYGLIDSPSDEGQLTVNGKLISNLPLSLEHSTMIMHGKKLGCIKDAIIMAAGLSIGQLPFKTIHPMLQKNVNDYNELIVNIMNAKRKFDDGQMSEPIMLRNMYLEWIDVQKESKATSEQWIKEQGISFLKIRQIQNKVRQLAEQLDVDLETYPCQEYDTLKLYLSITMANNTMVGQYSGNPNQIILKTQIDSAQAKKLLHIIVDREEHETNETISWTCSKNTLVGKSNSEWCCSLLASLGSYRKTIRLNMGDHEYSNTQDQNKYTCKIKSSATWKWQTTSGDQILLPKYCLSSVQFPVINLNGKTKRQAKKQKMEELYFGVYSSKIACSNNNTVITSGITYMSSIEYALVSEYFANGSIESSGLVQKKVKRFKKNIMPLIDAYKMALHTDACSNLLFDLLDHVQ